MTKFIKATSKDRIGSGFDGYLIMPYDHLVHHLGEPHDCTKCGPWRSSDNKVRVEWAFKSKHKKPTVITIYDYKENMTVKGVYVWHVGLKGDEKRFVDFFKEKGLAHPKPIL